MLNKGASRMKYQIFNFRTQCNVGKPYACRKRAQRRADKLDLEYGAISYSVKEVSPA
jgi:hypothetical protein